MEGTQPGRFVLIRSRAAEPHNSIFSLGELSKTQKQFSLSLRLWWDLLTHFFPPRVWQVSLHSCNSSTSLGNFYFTPELEEELGRYHLISLLSCLGKTGKRMLLNRLQWELGSLHEHLHGFARIMNTIHCIATLLRTRKTFTSMVSLLDLENLWTSKSSYYPGDPNAEENQRKALGMDRRLFQEQNGQSQIPS